MATIRAYFIKHIPITVPTLSVVRAISGRGIYIPGQAYIPVIRERQKDIIGELIDDSAVLKYLNEWVEGPNAGNGSYSDLRTSSSQLCLSQKRVNALVKKGKEAREARTSFHDMVTSCMGEKMNSLPEKGK
jgi:hypothetical protein